MDRSSRLTDCSSLLNTQYSSDMSVLGWLIIYDEGRALLINER
jgi:hypothetical protein